MGRSQPLYRIVATSRCKTHKPGTQIDYTGPRSGIAKGWRIAGRYVGTHTQNDGSTVTY